MLWWTAFAKYLPGGIIVRAINFSVCLHCGELFYAPQVSAMRNLHVQLQLLLIYSLELIVQSEEIFLDVIWVN